MGQRSKSCLVIRTMKLLLLSNEKFGRRERGGSVFSITVIRAQHCTESCEETCA